MHPVFFEIPLPWGVQTVYAYGVMLGLALLVGWFWFLRNGSRDNGTHDTGTHDTATRSGLDPNLLANTYLVGVISGLIGARLWFAVTHPASVAGIGGWIDIRSGGLATEGAWIGGFAGAAIYLRMKSTSWLAIADAASPSLVLGLLLTRIGSYLHGSDFGVRLGPDAPGWLQSLGTFPRWEGWERLEGSPAWLHHVKFHELSQEASASYPVHPTQLYEALFALGLLALTVWWWRRPSDFQGQLFLRVAAIYCAAQILIEPWIDDPERVRLLGFGLGQLVSMVLLFVLGLAWIQRRQQSRLHPAT